MKINTKNKLESTTNKEGGLAYELTPKERLYQRVLTCFFGEKKFYGNEDNNIISDLKLVAKEDPEYILKLASYARNEMYLRTIPQVLLVECAQLPEFKGTGLIGKYTNQIVQRADELTEILAYQLDKYKKPIPNSLLRGLSKAIHKFDEYQLSKYKGSKNKVKLKDVIKLIHPKPKNDTESKLYRDIMNDQVKPPQTWEHELMTKGASKETWDGIVPKMGYMALLRNLRNLVKHNANLEPVLTKIRDPDQVKKSKQYPFRFYSAYKELERSDANTTEVLDTINDALELSTVNLPQIKGTSFMSSDLSGSMESRLSERSVISYMDIACVMQAIAFKISDDKVYTSAFGESFAKISLSNRNSILVNTDIIKNMRVGHSTNGYKVIQHLNEKKLMVDRVMLFTDMQMYDSDEYDYWGSDTRHSVKDEWTDYKKINPNAKLYIFDLSGYGTIVVPPHDPNVALISGWSEKILEFVELFETDRLSMLDKISNYQGPK